MAPPPLLSFTDRGIFCPAGGFYIDPWRPVERALVTHGHSDHARPGHGAYLCTDAALPVIRHRLGPIAVEGIGWGEPRDIGGVTVSFHPAGHVPGSAQIRVARGGEVWVVSGDYKTEADGLAEAFAPLRCHAFITECTFGLPVFRWQPQAQVMARIAEWWAANAASGLVSVLGAYSFGKAQRLMAGLPEVGPILTHPAVEAVTEVLRGQGYRLPLTARAPQGKARGQTAATGALVIVPPAALGSAWVDGLGPSAQAFASGWMAVRGIRRRRGLGQGFTVSDHADWPGLLAAIADTGAERVFVTHGYTAPFQRHLAELGYDAGIVQTAYGGEGEGEATETAPTATDAPPQTDPTPDPMVAPTTDTGAAP